MALFRKSNFRRKKLKTREEIFREIGDTVLATPRNPGLPARDANYYVQDFEEKIKKERDVRRSRGMSLRQEQEKKQLQQEITEKEKKRSEKVAVLEEKIQQEFYDLRYGKCENCT